MSFSSDVKNELCRADIGARHYAVAECCGVLLFCNRFDGRGVRIVTMSDAFAARLPRLFSRAFEVSFDLDPEREGGAKHVFTVADPEKLGDILDELGYERRGLVSHHVNLGLLEDDGSRAAFLRGAFLAGGSVTDPLRRYHLELVTGHYTVSRELTALFHDMGFEPKGLSRGGNYVIYFKQSDAIEDLLTTAGAPVAAMRVMSARIEKGMTNLVNRKVNCDTANVTKSVEASASCLTAIRLLRESRRLEALPDKLREAARLREENPEMSLSELAALFDPPITKSGLSHRLRQLRELAEAASEGDN